MSENAEYNFMLIDIDYKISKSASAPTVRLFGKTEKENILVKVTDFYPYFYITEKTGLDKFIETDPIVRKWVNRLETATMKRYFGGEQIQLIQLFGSHPEQTPTIRQRFLQAGFEIHEADIPFVKRVLLDLNIRCLNVLKVKATTTQLVDNDIIIEAKCEDIQPVHKSTISSPDYFYKLKLMAFDIEVDHQTETIQQLITETGKRITVISYALGSNSREYKKKLFILEENTDSDEKRVIMEFLDDITRIQPDALITFNGDNFDIPYLLARMAKLGIENKLLSQFRDDTIFYSNRHRTFRIKGRISFDISPRTWGIHPVSGKKGLGDIAETVLDEGKINIQRTTGEIWRSGFLDGNTADRKLLKKYAQRDSNLTYQLFWKLGIQGWFEVIRLTGYPAGESPASTERIQGEFELMRFCRLKGVLIPMAPDDKDVAQRSADRKKNPHVGGTVLIPKGTLHIGVIISDFRSMYPSVCVAHNVGGETLKKFKEVEILDPLEMFNSKPQSCLSLMEATLINRREEVKSKIKNVTQKIAKTSIGPTPVNLLDEKEILNKEQYSLKIVANSMYGAHNYIRSRFYSITLGNAITNIARTYILRMEKLLHKISSEVTPVEIIYGDTDSAFIKILDEGLVINVYNENNPSKKKKKLDKLLSLTDKILINLNKQFPEAMDLTLEDIAYKLIFKPGRAKAYSYFSLLDSHLQIKGFEAVRSDWSFLSRDAQKKVLELILKEPVKKSKKHGKKIIFIDTGLEKATKFLINLATDILHMPTEELLKKAIVLSPIKKEPSKYKAKMPAVLAFLDFAKKEGLDPITEWKEYDKFPWVITPGTGLISERARHPKYTTDIDRDHYVTEILRASEGFGIKISLQDIKNKLTMEPIDEILKRFPTKSTDETESIDIANKKRTRKKSQQTQLSAFIDEEEHLDNQ